MNTRITSHELGSAIRPGLTELQNYFSGEEASEEKVDRVLKAVRGQAHLAATENNETLMLLKFGRAAGATPEDMRPIFQQIAGNYSGARQLPSGEAAGVKSHAITDGSAEPGRGSRKTAGK